MVIAIGWMLREGLRGPPMSAVRIVGEITFNPVRPGAGRIQNQL